MVQHKNNNNTARESITYISSTLTKRKSRVIVYKKENIDRVKETIRNKKIAAVLEGDIKSSHYQLWQFIITDNDDDDDSDSNDGNMEEIINDMGFKLRSSILWIVFDKDKKAGIFQTCCRTRFATLTKLVNVMVSSPIHILPAEDRDRDVWFHDIETTLKKMVLQTKQENAKDQRFIVYQVSKANLLNDILSSLVNHKTSPFLFMKQNSLSDAISSNDVVNDGMELRDNLKKSVCHVI
jgi:hypothetical protein